MARVLVVYHRHPQGDWRSTYQSHLDCFQRFSNHECYYLNSFWTNVPRSASAFRADLVIFHYTFLAVRQTPAEFDNYLERIAFIKDLNCPKAIMPHDEQAHADELCRLVRDFGVTHVFTPAVESEWRKIYAETDFDGLTFQTVLTGYVDDRDVARYRKRAAVTTPRPLDVGYRAWSVRPFYGRHGLLKSEIGVVFARKAPEFGLVTDISNRRNDAFLGASWFKFLLKSKYTLGVEGGSSVLDFDGSIAERTKEYMAEHEDATFEEIEAACFPGQDGRFDYFLLGPRHFEAVITRTCQVLVEGTYGGAFEAGAHYIPLARDFSNIDEVLETMRRDDLREGMVERAYRDIITSGAWTYRSLADLVFAECLGEEGASEHAGAGHRVVGAGPRAMWDKVVWTLGRLSRTAAWRINRVCHVLLWGIRSKIARLGWLIRVGAQRVWLALARLWFEGGLGDFWWKVRHSQRLPVRTMIRDAAVRLLGEERLWRLTVRAHNVVRRLRRRELLDLGGYVPSEAEQARREHRTSRERMPG